MQDSWGIDILDWLVLPEQSENKAINDKKFHSNYYISNKEAHFSIEVTVGIVEVYLVR